MKLGNLIRFPPREISLTSIYIQQPKIEVHYFFTALEITKTLKNKEGSLQKIFRHCKNNVQRI